MSVFSTLFGSSDKKDNSNSRINWISLENVAQLDTIVANSNDKYVFIFKHSTRCSISRFALKQFEVETLQCNVFTENDVDAYFLDLLEHRDISNEIASRFGVYHQSPQLILIKAGKAIYDVSHDAINAEEFKGKLAV